MLFRSHDIYEPKIEYEEKKGNIELCESVVYSPKASIKQNSVEDASDLSDPDDVKDKESTVTRSSRGYIKIIIGLRVLSVRVRELVFEKQSTSYKEVADELIRELIREGKMPSDAKNVFHQSVY